MPADRLVGYLRVLAENVHAAGLLPDGQSQVEIMQQQLKIEIGRLLSTKLEAGLTIASPHELGRLAAVPGQVMETFLAGAKTTISAGVKTYIQSLQTVPSGSAPGTSFQALWGDIVVIADAVRTLNGLLPEHAFMDQLQRTIEVRLVSELEADVQKVRWFQSHGTDSQGVKKDPATYYQNVAGKIRYMERAVLAFSAACKNDFSKGQVADAFNEFRKVADVAKFTDGIGAIIADPNFTFGNPAVLLAHLDGSMLDATMAGFGVEPIAERIKGKIVESFGQKISLALAKSPSADDLRNLLKEFNQIRKCVTLDPPTGESFTPGMLALRDALGECLDCVDSVLDKWVETHSVKFLNKLSQGEVGEGEWADLLGEVNRGLDDAGMAVDHGVALIRKNVTSWLDRQASDISNPIKAGQLEKAYSLLSKFGAIERYLDEDDPEDDDSLGESIRTVLQPVGAKKAEILRNIQSQVDLLLSIPNKSDIEQFLAVLKKCNGNDMGSGVKREFADMARSLAAKLALMSRDSFGLSNPMGQVRSDRSSDAGERLLPRGGQSPGIGSVVSWFRSARTASQRTASGLRETLPSIEPPFNGSYLPPLPVASPPASLPGVPDRIDAGGPGSRGIGLPDVVLAESPAAVPGGGSVVAASGPAIDLPGSTIMDNDDFQVVMVNSRVELRGGVAVVGTDRGIGYKDYAENQDRAMINPNAGRPILAVVDGMGGQADGEVAAKITNYCLALVGTNLDATGLQAAKEYLLSDLPLKVFPNTVFSSATPRERYKTGLETQLNTISDVESALRVANQIIIEYNNRKGYGDNGSGACLSTAEIDGDRCRVRSAGDAKLIVISTDGSISFETDDALKAFRDRRGFEDSGEVERYHRERNVVADAIGADGFRADDRTVTLSRGDVVIMASDGLWDNLTPEEVVQLTRGKTPDEAFSILSTATALASICAESGDANDVVKYHSFLRLSGFRSDQVPLQQPKADNRSLLIYRHEGTAVAQPQPPLVSAPASPPNTGPSPVGVAPGDDPVSPLPAPDVPTPGAEGQLVPEAVRFTAADLSPGYSCGKVDLGDSITNVVNLRTVLGVTISGKALTLEKFDVPENGSCGFYALAQTAQEPAVGRIEEEAGFGTVGTQAQAKLKMETADPETGMDPFRVSLLRDLGRFDAKATELQSGDATMFEKYTTGLLSQIHNKVANYTAESRRAVGTTKQRLEVARDAWCRVQEARERGESDGDVRKLAFVARLTELNSTTGSKPFDGQILSKEGMAEPDDILVLARLLNKPTIVLGNYDRVAGSDDAFNTMTALSSHPGVDPSECRIIAHSGGVHWVYLAVRRDFE
ncbi:hypothetical protein EBR96_03905 [bacterium]|nr:hypothetical protein [bacterium]